ncbi:glycosyltransferase family 87 protein [Ktedonospora formicarum]|uniref:DUF2029 domain-containing protein n=1 Tax=Ktedonospora formicarum TaxID=2778364 RepID=A0A8J3IB25_9CHLR|nr:glycosyltransferase family 87 protein [Ktedonospora formicarum]GHO50025.1 hypothetical protein KSX_81880 [Ktedonospora formicarum]
MDTSTSHSDISSSIPGAKSRSADPGPHTNWLFLDPVIIALIVVLLYVAAAFARLLPGMGIWHACLDMGVLVLVGALLLYKAILVVRWGQGRGTSRLLLDLCVCVLMGALLFYGASWQLFKTYTDAAKYNCYAQAFWQGSGAVKDLPPEQCRFIFLPVTFDQVASPQEQQQLTPSPSLLEQAERFGLPASWVQQLQSWQSTSEPGHMLPNEYPLPVLLPFSLGLLSPQGWYQVGFALWMVLLACLIFYLLDRYRSRDAAIACALYFVTGCWATAAGRFDLLPALFTLLAVMAAARGRWKWAFAHLALATLCKFYPVILLFPFLLQQQLQVEGRWYARRRWTPLLVFVGVCVGIVACSMLLSVEGTLKPLTYFGARPIQVESFPASLMWLTSLLAGIPLSFKFTYGSLNVFGAPEQVLGNLTTVLLLVGLGYTYWLQWQGKIDLAMSSLLTLLVIVCTSKVFSPQYLIWLAPLVAYIGGGRWRWLLSWGLLGALTTLIYPYIYISVSLAAVPSHPLFFPVVTIRDFLLLGFTLALLIAGARGRLAIREPTYPVTPTALV